MAVEAYLEVSYGAPVFRIYRWNAASFRILKAGMLAYKYGICQTENLSSPLDWHLL